MGLIDSLMNRKPAATTTNAANGVAPAAPAKPAAPASPLAPAFDRASVKGQAVKTALRESEWLGKNFKACKMEVANCSTTASANFYGYGTHKPMTMNVRGALPEGRLDLVIALNVSGHDLKDYADKEQRLAARAKDNKYVIQVTHADGRKETMSGIAANGKVSVAQDISIRGMQPGKTIVEAWPEGSAGVGGYIEGRRLEINYNPPGGSAPVDRFG